ncbi:Pentatricopeptide repeat [Dillenia turbinata]|uniref:Pentatricopeptide repeat n=1 Tax=Dillenia turbinata TaxID=194707 RepID=A0AAN8ZF57_9MAGN
MVHAKVIKSLNYKHGFIGDRLVSGYCGFLCFDDAKKLFSEIPDKDLVSWNYLISGFSRNGYVLECLKSFPRLRLETNLEPREVTLAPLISVCIDTRALGLGKSVHRFAVKYGLLWEVKFVNSIINMYGNDGNVDVTVRLFKAMPFRTMVSWNSVIRVFVENGLAEEGIRSLDLMRNDGGEFDHATIVALVQGTTDVGVARLVVHGLVIVSGFGADTNVSTALLDSYTKLGRLILSPNFFSEMRGPDRVAWTALLAGYAVHGHCKHAIKLFELMVEEGIEPDHVGFIHLVNACSHSGLWTDAAKIRILMKRGCNRNPGYSFIEHLSKIYSFVVGDQTHLESERIHAKLEEVITRIRQAGLMECVLHEEVKGDMINSHSEKLAMEFGLSVTDAGTPLIITKNLKVCDDCHGMAKVVSQIEKHNINYHSEKLAIGFGLLVTDAGTPVIITKNVRVCDDCHGMAKVKINPNPQSSGSFLIIGLK